MPGAVRANNNGMNMDWGKTRAAIWRHQEGRLRAVDNLDPVSLDSLVGMDRQKEMLTRNTDRFINKQPANNALLWGSRGTGKSSLIKAVLNTCAPRGLRLIEIYKNDLHDLPQIVDEIREQKYRFIFYCDDFSFEENENQYVALKTLLEGSIEAPPENALLYATSNRRHLVPEYMKDNLDSGLVEGELHYSDSIEEKISLSDRFGLWISFYPPTQEEYLAIVDSYFPDYTGDRDALHAEAVRFARQRASRSGRTARQFYNFYSGTGN